MVTKARFLCYCVMVLLAVVAAQAEEIETTEGAAVISVSAPDQAAEATVAKGETDEEAAKVAAVLTAVQVRMQQTVTISFRDTPIEDVLQMLAQQADVDIVKSPMVEGNVTATLTDIPLSEALDNILAAHGYGYIATENMIRVVPRSDIINVPQKMVSQVYKITYAEVKEVEKSLAKFISPQGTISSNPGTGHLIVSDIEKNIEAIDAFIKEIDTETEQVLVEVRIYDVTNSDALDLGITWAATNRSTNPYIGGAFDSSISVADTVGLLNYGIINDKMLIDAVLRAEMDKSCAKLLANPRVLVLDNETANFAAVTQIPYQQLNQGGGSSEAYGTTEFKDVGVMLEVTPHIAKDGMIRMHILPEFSVQTGTVDIFFGIGAVAPSSAQPIVDKRSAETKTLIKDGQTVVIGGLRKQALTKQESKVPILADIPLLGGLFKFNSEAIVNSELVIFITPKIVQIPTLDEEEAIQLDAVEFTKPGCDPKMLIDTDECSK